MKTHLLHGPHLTRCGIMLEWVNGHPYDRKRVNGNALKVTEHKHGVSCASCRKARGVQAP